MAERGKIDEIQEEIGAIDQELEAKKEEKIEKVTELVEEIENEISELEELKDQYTVELDSMDK
ncbi:hypothetical protein [Spiroplasma endosymbiont of Aspidapion aeneum]|uniref:hypothetical protein n=1 Tax=Spiroplasma endosymbiont of Aspidapion aeneum TaxID=3066276 RepID=UPI00313BB556